MGGISIHHGVQVNLSRGGAQHVGCALGNEMLVWPCLGVDSSTLFCAKRSREHQQAR